MMGEALKKGCRYSIIYAGLLVCNATFAHLPEQYGREYIRIDPDSYEPPKNRDRTRPLRPPIDSEAVTAAQVRAEEEGGGAYGPGLADPLVNLFELQLERGDVDEAVDSLRRALQLVRINDGLYSESQIPLLRRLIKLYQARGYYAALGDVYGHYYRVITAHDTPVTQEQLPRLLEYLAWERQLYSTRGDGSERAHLLRAYEAAEYLLQQAEPSVPAIYLDLAMSQLRNLYLILGEYSLESLPADLSREAKRFAAIQRLAEGTGRRLLEDCLARLEHAPPLQRAGIHRELGDWLLWNGRWLSAQNAYDQVITLMRAADALEELDAWFGEPVELPDERDLWSLLHEENGTVPVVVEASYEVSRKGEARGVEVSTSDKAQKWQASRIARMLRDSHFRPRIGDDGFESGPRVTRYYRLIGTR